MRGTDLQSQTPFPPPPPIPTSALLLLLLHSFLRPHLHCLPHPRIPPTPMSPPLHFRRNVLIDAAPAPSPPTVLMCRTNSMPAAETSTVPLEHYVAKPFAAAECGFLFFSFYCVLLDPNSWDTALPMRSLSQHLPGSQQGSESALHPALCGPSHCSLQFIPIQRTPTSPMRPVILRYNP